MTRLFVQGLGPILSLALILAAPTEAAAAAGPDGQDRFAIEFDLGTRLIYTGSYELFSERPGLVNAQVSMAWLPGAYANKLALDLRLAQAGSRATSFDVLESRLAVSTAMLGASFRQPLLEVLAVVARAGLGADYVRVILDDDAGAEFRGSAWAPVVEGTAALELVTPTYRVGRVQREILFRVEGGYGWRPFGAGIKNLERDYDEDDPAPIERTAVGLGNLDLSGFVIRGAIGYRF